MEGGSNLWRGDPKNWNIINLLEDYKELSAKVSVGADFAHNVFGALCPGVLQLAVVKHSATGECLFGRTFARRVINYPIN